MGDFASFQRDYCAPEGVPLTIEYARMEMPDTFFASMEPRIAHAFDEMEKLEAGAIANPDEGRMVGHYWLRDFARLPGSALRAEVEADHARVLEFLADVSNGRIAGSAGPFRHLLSVGIGGSALGPQLLADALGHPETDKLHPVFLDNTDPDGIARALAGLKGELGRTLTVVISKSGGTPETRNGMLLVEDEYKRAGLDFGRHAVAVTGVGSKLDKYAEEGGWLARLPMYDWVGGRTSLWSAVGLIPAGLQGIDVGRLLAGAAAMDGATRVRDARANPAALLALCWFHGTDGRGERDMVVIPYKDRLALMSRYLQQLIMESLGKEHDLDGAVVEQGIAVYGNKGSTDQHAYVQQLRDGVPNFFATFIEVLEDGGRDAFAVEEGVTAGDYLLGFLLGTRQALSEKGRRSLTITLERVDAFSVGALLALYERAVGFYASLVNINAYHQPGVEAGKKAAAVVLDVQHSLMAKLRGGGSHTASEWAAQLGGDAETCYKILEHLAANGRGVAKEGSGPGARFRAAG